MPTDINFTSSGTTTNTATNTGWTCRPSNDGSFGTCSRNDNSSSFNYVCSGRQSDGTWSRCEVDTPVLGARNTPGSSSSGDSVRHVVNLDSPVTYNPHGQITRSDQRFEEFNTRNNVQSLNFRSNLGEMHTLNYDKQGNLLSGTQLREKYEAYLKNNPNPQPKNLDKSFEDKFKKYDSFEQFKQDAREALMQKSSGSDSHLNQPVKMNSGTDKEKFDALRKEVELREAKEKEQFNKLKQESSQLQQEIEKSWANCTPEEEVYKNSSISKEYMIKIGLIPPRVEKKPEDKIDTQIKELVEKFIETHPKYKDTLTTTEYSSLKEELIKAAENTKRSKGNSLFDMFQKMSLISSAKANPVGIAIVAEEIIALGGNVLISAIVANKAIEDYNKYQELEDTFSKPQVLSTPVQEQYESKESFPAQEPSAVPLPGFEAHNISDKMPLAEEFPITEIEYENLISLKEGDHTTKSRLKDQQLPTEGKIRFVPDSQYFPSMPLAKGPNNGFYDRFDNEWVKGPSRTEGEPFEWDVQLSETGKAQLGHLSGDGKHINVSLKGRITHK